MRPLRFHWHRLNEWLDDLGSARAFARVRRDNALGRLLFGQKCLVSKVLWTLERCDGPEIPDTL